MGPSTGHLSCRRLSSWRETVPDPTVLGAPVNLVPHLYRVPRVYQTGKPSFLPKTENLPIF